MTVLGGGGWEIFARNGGNPRMDVGGGGEGGGGFYNFYNGGGGILNSLYIIGKGMLTPLFCPPHSSVVMFL